MFPFQMTVRKAVESILISVSNLSALHMQLLLTNLLPEMGNFGSLSQIPVWSSSTETSQNSVIQLNGVII